MRLWVEEKLGWKQPSWWYIPHMFCYPRIDFLMAVPIGSEHCPEEVKSWEDRQFFPRGQPEGTRGLSKGNPDNSTLL